MKQAYVIFETLTSDIKTVIEEDSYDEFCLVQINALADRIKDYGKIVRINDRKTSGKYSGIVECYVEYNSTEKSSFNIFCYKIVPVNAF